jgi:hypothetical protein
MTPTDIDALQDFVPTVTEAQMKLHADMRRDTDPRWQLPDDAPVTRLNFRSLVAIGIAGTAIGSACLLWLIF